MYQILLLGAGKSSGALIQYLSRQALSENWTTTVADIDTHTMSGKTGELPGIEYRTVNVSHTEVLGTLVGNSDIVISLLPPDLHMHIAMICLEKKRHFLTASYASDEMRMLDKQAREKGLLFLNELGADPGIDHMTAKECIEAIRQEGGKITGFESFTGGLPAAESVADNPWHYKFSWNPRNVVLAGQGNAKFIQEGNYKYIPYHRLFRRTEIIEVPGLGLFEGYANRDSLKYVPIYELQDIKTLYRGTLRRPGFCRAWNTFVQLGATDDSYQMSGTERMSYREFINSFLYHDPHSSVEIKVAHYMNFEHDGEEMHRLRWLGIFDKDKKIGIKNATPAQALLKILSDKWSMTDEDKDMLVMWHAFTYHLEGVEITKNAYLSIKGMDSVNTAMAIAVGLPLGIAVKLIKNGIISDKGVHLPTLPHFYSPILRELNEEGISLKWV